MGFRARIRLGMYLIIVLVMTFSVSTSIYLQNRSEIKSLNRLGEFIALDLSYNSMLGILSEEPANLKQPLKALLNEQQVLGAEVYLADGKLIAGEKRHQYEINLTAEKRLMLVNSSQAATFTVKTRTSSGQWLRSYFAKVTIEKSDDDLFNIEVGQRETHDGFVRVDLTLNELTARKLAVLYQNLMLIPVYIFAGLLLSTLVERRISKPLMQLKVVALRIANGNFSTRMAVESDDEIGSLAATFNHMSEQLSTTVTELNAANKLLEKANVELRDFTYVVSHDLQAPLRKLHSFGEFLFEDCSNDLPEQGKDYIRRMQKATERMKALIQDLLKLSRIGTAEDSHTTVDVATVVQNATDDLSVAIEESGAEIVVGQLPVVRGNSTQLTQLFENLIGNAIKYHSEDRPPRVEIAANEQDDEVVFSIKDNGIGIEERFFDKIFGVFQRLHGDGGKYEGTGIGLALCKKIVHRHKGKMWIESTFGTGTTIYFTMSRTAVSVGGTKT